MKDLFASRLSLRFHFIVVTLLLTALSCNKNERPSNNSNETIIDTSDGSGGSGGGSGGGGNNGGGSSQSLYSCVGAASEDGDGSGSIPLYQFPIQIAGPGECQVGSGCATYFDIPGATNLKRGQWVPGALKHADAVINGAMPPIESSYAKFKVDGAYRVRIITNPEIFPPAGTATNCYGRKTGIGSTSAFPYTKLKYDVWVRAYTAVGHSTGNYDANQSNFGDRIKIATVGPIEVGQCSEPLVISPSVFAPIGNFADPDMFFLIEIDNVQSDYLCGVNPNNQNCAGDGMKAHRSFGCVNATLQIATDITDQFKLK